MPTDLGPAIEAGAHAVAEQLRLRRNGTDDPFRDSVDTEIDALAKAAIEAALPELRKAIAEECAQAIDVRVREYRDLIMPDRYTNVLIEAVAIVRGQSGGGEHG